MTTRKYQTLHLDANSSKGTTRLLLFYTDTVGSSTMSI